MKKSLLNLKNWWYYWRKRYFLLAKKLTSDVWKLFMFYLALGWTWLWVICKLQLPTNTLILESRKLQNRPNSNIHTYVFRSNCHYICKYTKYWIWASVTNANNQQSLQAFLTTYIFLNVTPCKWFWETLAVKNKFWYY